MAGEAVQQLPDKLYFRIGEVSDIVGVKPYVLRYWETEFTDVKPSKSKSGQRLYKKRDVELLLRIKALLYNERFTINGAKQRLKEVVKSVGVVQPEVEAPVATQDVQKEDVQQRLDFEDHPVETTTDKKFLNKIKQDLEWCLSELRSE